jgi:subtilisin family serine protease
LIETQSGDQLILLRFTNSTPGIWRFNVYNRSDIYTTIISLGNAIVPITVIAYNDSNESLYLNASRGYTRTGVIKPEIAAPDVNVTGPTLQKGFTSYTGTSVAATHTAGVVAMLLEWEYVKGNLPNMNMINLKILIIRGARRKEDIEYPNHDWGYGILDIYRVFYSLRTNIPQK